MTTNFSMLFYIKKQKNYEAGPVPIYLRITVKGKRAELVTTRECEPARWNSKAGRAKGSKEDTWSLNAYLDFMQSKVYEAQRVLQEKSEPVTAIALKCILIGKHEKEHMFIEVFKDHNRKMAVLVGQEIAAGTLERYETSLRHTREFLQYYFKVSDIEIKKIDNAFINEYDYYLRTVRKCSNNTTVKYIKNFGKIIRICLANGWIKTDPFLNYKGKIKIIDRNFLSEEELQLLATKLFASERLTQVRDIFLFCCYTGLAYADVQKLERSQIRKGVDGDLWIFTNRQKTDQRSAIPLLPTALKLIEKYAEHPVCNNKGKLLPVSSNQKMNDYLKEIAVVCGINKTMTFHMARHTFATTITLNNGVPIESVSKMLGHATLKQTQHYAKILDIKLSADMFQLKQKFK